MCPYISCHQVDEGKECALTHLYRSECIPHLEEEWLLDMLELVLVLGLQAALAMMEVAAMVVWGMDTEVLPIEEVSMM